MTSIESNKSHRKRHFSDTQINYSYDSSHSNQQTNTTTKKFKTDTNQTNCPENEYSNNDIKDSTDKQSIDGISVSESHLSDNSDPLDPLQDKFIRRQTMPFTDQLVPQNQTFSQKSEESDKWSDALSQQSSQSIPECLRDYQLVPNIMTPEE